ncbi:hypothetical protein B0J13DRAFT_53493 [Dactylonectria estremocensis]|uniref:SRm160/300 splicing coactivator n=1 Tax=Dactylonectria estremocensis TaxID=1079267 RepID=A0A9P9EPI8_9HYPO|nr:hypothetical protein B0J13DRAFT_53493 [Dactylonectria estremocensis]
MSSPNTVTEDDPSPEPATPEIPEAPVTPHKASATKKIANAKVTPKSAPVAGRARARTTSKRPEPTLLADFLLGRPSPARIAADRQRRMSLEAVKAELRHEMKQSAVRQVQPPGGVKDRVKKWQKANAAITIEDGADDAVTEPTDLAFNGEDIHSVTEEDRIRIKMKNKFQPINKSQETFEPKNEPPQEETPKIRPKKRVVSDEHWRKNRTKKGVSKNANGAGPTPIPKDFTIRNAANPTVSSKVKSWASKVEIPDTPPPRSHRYAKSVGSRAWTEDTESELYSDLGETVSDATPSLATNSRVTGQKSAKSVSAADDGIRVTPIRKMQLDDDGIRVRPMSAVSSEAGTSQPGSVRTARLRRKSAHSSRRSSPRSERTKVAEKRRDESKTELSEEHSELTQTDTTADESQLSRTTKESHSTVNTEDRDSVLDTPTKRRSVSGSRRRPRPKSFHSGSTARKDQPAFEEETDLEPPPMDESDLSSSILAKSIADIPGEIPFGNSAFSELDLPLHGGPPRSRPKRPKVDRNTSFKSMPSVFKKVMEEGKKMIHEMNEPPRHALPNNPPSIEKWLNNTVETNNTSDPFVDNPEEEQKKESVPVPKEESAPAPEEQTEEHEPTPETVSPSETKTRRKSSRGQKRRASAQKLGKIEAEKLAEPPVEAPQPSPEPKAQSVEERTPEPKRQSAKEQTKPPHSSGLKRSRATRTTSTPIKSGTKKQLLGMLKEAFQGESGNQLPKPKPYQSREERMYEHELDSEPSYRYDDDDRYDDERTFTTYDEQTEDWEESDVTRDQSTVLSKPRSVSPVEEDRRDLQHDDRMQVPPLKMLGPRLRPPTNGHHELSTILSEEGSSAVGSDLTSSTMTDSTVTQSTVLTGESELSKSRNQGSGLKRRLTRHSDLVSVLSLPNDNDVPTAIKSNRSRPSFRKNRAGPDDVTTDDLLREFADDENLYLRELKTLVDGVIPVLLSQVVNDDNATELFGSGNRSSRVSSMSKSVIHMGVALEKLKIIHRKAPVSDMRRLATWGHGVVPIYHKYLDAWRLGFQDLVVNLAPASGNPDDEDSLLDAMPRNEYGDIVDAEGERVDVAHLLKRPLLRVKQMAKFFKCIDSIIGSNDSYYLVRDFEDLQDKSRRRHREESARLIDEDANNTDTTRSRDLRTLAPMEYVTIETTRQVSAKDFFSLDLAHSNGQRLECQVELVHRDNERHPEDKGDILIRETGGGRRSYLLFPPIPMEIISARTGEGNFDMVVMIRGTHDDRPWHELLTLTTDNEDQILDWLDVLPVAPVPPREPEPSVCGDDEATSKLRMNDVPVGVRGSSKRSHKSSRSPRSSHSPHSPLIETSPASPQTPTKRSLPSRYRPRSAGPSTPPPATQSDDLDLERTPTQDDYSDRIPEERSTPLSEDMRPDPSMFQKTPNSTPYRDDGAPPPPVHRTLSPSPSPQSSSKSQSINPPVELQANGRIKRRTSSPLKHEYLPSEGSSIAGTSLTDGTDMSEDYTETESDYESSDDEIESVDLPETELGVSIKEERVRPPPLVESIVSDSAYSLTPSNSASQAGLHGHKIAPEENALRFSSSISKWSDKGGNWKDISAEYCTIIVSPGLIEAYAPHIDATNEKPMLALDLTPVVLIRQSTVVDLEIRSAVKEDCLLSNSHGGGNFRFRCHTAPDCFNLYKAVHHARLNNQKFIELENEARFKSFGERKGPIGIEDDTSSRRKSWFGRKNSYRSSVRAPSQSHDGASTTPSSSLSATSFLKRLTGGTNLPFNLARSSVDRQIRASGYGNSLYTPDSSSGANTPRSPSISVESSGRGPANMGTENIRIRLHLLISAAKWEDFGNCSLQIRRPPPGWRQALRANHGLEKRVTVTTIPRKDSDKPVILLDAVLGSGCFQQMGTRGIVCGVWEEMKDDNGVVGAAPATGATGGNVKKWCFQFANGNEAHWVLQLVHQEVMTF